LPNANQFSFFFNDRLSSKFPEKRYYNISSHLERVVALPCETFVLKNRNDPKLGKRISMQDSSI